MRFLKLMLAVGALLLVSTALTLSATAAPFSGGEDVPVSDCYPAGEGADEEAPLDEELPFDEELPLEDEPIDEDPVDEEPITDGYGFLEDLPLEEDPVEELGSNGDDEVECGEGDDTLELGEGDDEADCADGDDVLHGGP